MQTYFVDVFVRKQDRNGNTYHDVAIYNVRGDLLVEVFKQYGYGCAYEQTAYELLDDRKLYRKTPKIKALMQQKVKEGWEIKKCSLTSPQRFHHPASGATWTLSRFLVREKLIRVKFLVK